MRTTEFKHTYLNADDLTKPALVTIKDIAIEKVGTAEKMVMYTEELESAIALNKTCLLQLEEVLGSDETDDWIGAQVVVFNDRSVQFQGKRVGGIRFRAPKNGVSRKERPAASAEVPADDTPF